MAVSKALLLIALVVISFGGFCGAVAKVPSSPSAKAAVASGQESSSLLARVSYSDLSDLFGGASITDTGSSPNGDDDRETIDRLVVILRRSHHKIAPLLRKIEEAFGTTSGAAPPNRLPALGFLEVTGLPLEMVALRKSLLPKASALANLDFEELSALEKPETGYSIGWSHGRESFRVFDTESEPKRRYDTAKGSFYMNPYADANTQNVYPPSLQPSLENDLLQMTRFMSKVGLWIAVLCDLYLDAAAKNTHCSQELECPSRDTAGSSDDIDGTNLDFTSSISTNQWMVYKSLKYGKPAAKARLLYYFPQQQQQNDEISAQTDSNDVFDDWCGWHTDHGTLTALLPGMLCGGNGEPGEPLPSSSQGPKPGLYIKTKIPEAVGTTADGEWTPQYHSKERLVHVDLAQDSLGFQLGETLEILSGGKFVSTPHAVKAPPSPTTKKGAVPLGRASLAVFLQPLASQILPPLAKTSDRDQSGMDGGVDDVFSLPNRWRSTFGEFQRVTIESFS